jgi:outer membrane protein TolC
MAIVLAAGLALAVLNGCGQQNLLRPGDRDEVFGMLHLPAHAAADAHTPPPDGLPDEPATVTNAEREPRFLSLMEAIALALQQGRIGSQSVRVPGLADDDLVHFAGGGVFGSDSIRVLALAPALAGAGIDREQARFDAQWTTSMAWAGIDEPTYGLSPLLNGQSALFSTTLAKPLPTGGVAGITFGTDYRNLSNPPTAVFPTLNPSYTSRVLVGFEQPLLRGYGVEANQLLPTFPGASALFPGVNGRGGGEGILVARVRFEQQRAEFDRNVNYLLLNVEAAYWHLYGAYVNLYGADQAVRLAHQAWRISKTSYDKGTIDLSDYAPTRVQYERARGDRLQTLGRVLEAERTLRQLLGLPVEDGKRLVPADAPTLAPYEPDWRGAVEEAMNKRPELALAREELKVRQLQLAARRNALLPDLRLQASYATIGLGQRLDGDATYVDSNGLVHPDNSWRALASNHFNDWTVGLTLNMPLGFREERAAIRQATLLLAQSYGVLKEQEARAQNALARQFRKVLESHKVIEVRRQERKVLARQLETRFHKFALGQLTVDFLLETQRQWTAALAAEHQAIVEYNIALAAFEFSKGTIQQYDSVVIADGPLPACARVQAVEHERERTRAHVLRQREGVSHAAPSAGPALPHAEDDAPLELAAVLDPTPQTRWHTDPAEAVPAFLPRTLAIPVTVALAGGPRAQLSFEPPRAAPSQDRAAAITLPALPVPMPAALTKDTRPYMTYLSTPKMPDLPMPKLLEGRLKESAGAGPVGLRDLPMPRLLEAPPKRVASAGRVNLPPPLPPARLAAPLAEDPRNAGRVRVPELPAPRLGEPLTEAEWGQGARPPSAN